VYLLRRESSFEAYQVGMAVKIEILGAKIIDMKGKTDGKTLSCAATPHEPKSFQNC